MSKRCCAASCYNSSTNNRSVEYFGFPKNMEYASAWAKAAGREDLLVKSLNNIIKYFLCSEHFSADSFLDPPHNRMLKKSSRPVIVPIPTIFKDNFKECVSKSVKEDRFSVVAANAEALSTSLSLDENAVHEVEALEPLNLLQPLIQHSVENIENFLIAGNPDEHTELVQCGEGDAKAEADDASRRPTNCRLCLSATDNDLLIPIFADGSEVAYILDRLLPDTIKHNDGFPQEVCLVCLESATRCLNTIEKFKEIQENLRS